MNKKQWNKKKEKKSISGILYAIVESRTKTSYGIRLLYLYFINVLACYTDTISLYTEHAPYLLGRMTSAHGRQNRWPADGDSKIADCKSSS